MAEAQPKDGPVELDTLPKLNEEITTAQRSYTLKAVLGTGGYGVVYLSQIGDKAVAIKTEKYNRLLAHTEEIVLRATNDKGATHFCELIDSGSVPPNYIYTVMTLLHHDLTRLRYEMLDRKFTASTAVRLAMQALEAIEELHSVGFLSRDVKPSNFAPGHHLNGQSKTIFMYDFGLARRYVDRAGKVIASRGEMGWRGTTRYGSLNAHQRLDLGRCDDLESWLYMIVELTNGNLPWRKKNDREFVGKFKQKIRLGTDRTTFFSGCPTCYGELLTQIDALHFDSAPAYAELRKPLQQYCSANGVLSSTAWDWEEDSDSIFSEKRTDAAQKQTVIASA